MRRSGAWLAVRALEKIGVRHTFGIPGVHNTELYDELRKSKRITPILVTHEQGAAFMAEAIGRTSETIGCLAIVPAAGMAYAMAGIGEAYLDGVPLLVVSGGIRRDSGRHYQLHQIDQMKVLDGITKAAFLVERHEDVVPRIYEAYAIATSGEPGPVFVELSGDLLMFRGEARTIPPFVASYQPPEPADEEVERAAEILQTSDKPGIYVGWGARFATTSVAALAERLGSPVSTTMQGLSVFPHDHPLHAGMGFGQAAVPAARKAFAGVDCLLAVGVRFAELATASYGLPVPERLIHVDINPEVFHKNYRAELAIESDAALFAKQLLGVLETSERPPATRRREEVQTVIASEKEAFRTAWATGGAKGKVNPGVFFPELRRQLDRDAYLVLDDGNHTFLAAEQMPIYESRHLISPTDFNCMGYAVPAAIGVKFANQKSQVAAIVGDGAFMMTGLEILTASTFRLGVIFFVFHDGELGQISQFQHLPLGYKTCTVIGDLRVAGVASATGAAYLAMPDNGAVPGVIAEAVRLSSAGSTVIVDVAIDYSRKTEFTKGVVKVNLGRFPLGEKLRFLGRAAKRHAIG